MIDSADANPSVRNAALICAAQKIEQYEIALYGCLTAYARLLSLTSVQKMLEEILAQERAADIGVTQIAEDWVNLAAAQPQG